MITMKPHLRIRDAARAMEFYKQAFGAVEVSRLVDPEGKIAHAEMKIGDSVFGLGEEAIESGSPSPQTLGGSTVAIDLFLDDVDAFAERAIAAGAKVVFPIQDHFYGMRQGRLVDPFGHMWVIGTEIEPMSPDEMQRRFDELTKQGR